LVSDRLRLRADALNHYHTYADLIDTSFDIINTLGNDQKAEFISGHPRIGETKNLSMLSAKEQAARATPPEVLERLVKLNDLYEDRFPKLRYITFVNGRSRSQIADELNTKLSSVPEPVEIYSRTWETELARALNDVKLIAKSRLISFGVQ